MWFDRGELDTAIRAALERPESASRIDSKATATEARCRILRCQRCQGTEMIASRFGRVSDVVLDHCPRCSGDFADAGELKALVEWFGRPGKPEQLRALGLAIADALKERQMLEELGSLGRDLKKRAPLYLLFLPKIILPLGTSARAARFPIATILLILVNVLLYIVIAASEDPRSVLDTFGLVPARIVKGESLLTFVTSIFLHGGVVHLLGNMLFLWIFARALEGALGWGRFLGAYLLCGLAAGGAFLLSHLNLEFPGIGASGAISGMMGAFLVLFPTATVATFIFTRVVDIPAWVFLGVWIAFQLLYGFILDSTCLSSNVGYSAHIGGFIAGVLLGLLQRKTGRRRLAAER